VLFIGDIVGRPGRGAVKSILPELVTRAGIDFVIANGENLAAGNGMTYETYKEMTHAGIDYFTSGNHIWKNKDIIPHLNNSTLKVLRPLNYPKEVPGRGSAVLEKGKKKFFLVNLLGRVFIEEDLDDPFRMAQALSARDDLPILIDFHAEATSEKNAFGRFLDGRIAAIVGTHTHVQTCDETIFPNGTGFISDVGMTGPIDSVLGVEKEIIIEKFLTQLPVSHKVASGEVKFCAVVIEIDSKRRVTTSIERISQNLNIGE